MIDTATLMAAHGHASKNRSEIAASSECGCFYCKSVVGPSQFYDWVDDGQTALCPRCGVDALIGDKSGHPITDQAFLKAMHQHWFEG